MVRSVVIFSSILTSSFWHILVSCIGLSHIHIFSFKYFSGSKCLIYINLCTFNVLKKNSARLQWYSCARHKAPGPLVFILSVCLFVCLFVVNFNLHYNFWTERDRYFIFGMHTPLMTPFQMTPRSLILWPWLWPWS